MESSVKCLFCLYAAGFKNKWKDFCVWNATSPFPALPFYLKIRYFQLYFYCFHCYRCAPLPAFACLYPAPTPPLPCGHHHTVVCVHGLCIYALWLIPSPAYSQSSPLPFDSCHSVPCIHSSVSFSTEINFICVLFKAGGYITKKIWNMQMNRETYFTERIIYH